QDMRAVAAHHVHLHHPVEDRIRMTEADVGFHSHGINAFLRALPVGKVLQAFDDAFLSEVDWDGSTGLCHRKPFRQAVDGYHLPGAQEDRAADCHLAHRATAPYRYRVCRLDVTLDG